MGYGQRPMEDSLSYDSGEDDEDVIGGVASTSDLSGEGLISFGPVGVLSATANTVKIADKDWKNDQFLTRGGSTVHVVSGMGKGQIRTISGNSQDTIIVSPTWTVLPDTTSTLVIRELNSEVVGERRSLYAREDIRNVERLGGLYHMNYQIQVITQSQELTIYLHTILRSIFTISRQFLEKQGIINLKMGATDFIPRSEYQPDLAYMRAMNVEFEHPFSVFVEDLEVATNFRIVLEQCLDGITTDLSDTTTTAA